ncbi:MAG: Fis family transcriptional regulator, partial [Deltaproteobacteria bacterium]|nr:Fis family transcriptional regulator [Deltaproteobacteria bacterium]
FIRRFNAKRDKQIAGVTPQVMDLLMRHGFAGNARELENAIEYGFVLCHNRLIDVQHLPETILPENLKTPSADTTSNLTELDWAESDVIRAALERTEWKIGSAAQALGISRTTLWRKMKKHGISTSESL